MFYIEYKDKNHGQTFIKYFKNKPNVTNAYCPHCDNQVMDRQVVVESAETHVYFKCLHCDRIFEEYDVEFIKANSVYLDPIVYLEVHEINYNNNLDSVVTSLKNLKDKEIKNTFDEKDKVKCTVYTSDKGGIERYIIWCYETYKVLDVKFSTTLEQSPSTNSHIQYSVMVIYEEK